MNLLQILLQYGRQEEPGYAKAFGAFMVTLIIFGVIFVIKKIRKK